MNYSTAFIVKEPLQWANPPITMTFSKLNQIEMCPRKWALTSSDYPEIWEGNGYPETVSLSIIRGRVIHRCIETVLRELINKNFSCTDENIVTSLKGLGGLSLVIEESISKVISYYVKNPRANQHLNHFEILLQEKKGDIREDIAILLSRNVDKSRSETKETFSRRKTKRLVCGSYSEIRLVDEDLKWEGVADIIKITRDTCEIRDIKSGLPREDHADQVRIYNYLWLNDKIKNPTAKQATKLTISYIAEDVDVPPLKDSEIDAFRDELIARTKVAKEKVSKIRPKAITGVGKCCICSVRHLCNEYWEKDTLDLRQENKATKSMIDIDSLLSG